MIIDHIHPLRQPFPPPPPPPPPVFLLYVPLEVDDDVELFVDVDVLLVGAVELLFDVDVLLVLVVADDDDVFLLLDVTGLGGCVTGPSFTNSPSFQTTLYFVPPS